MITYSPLYPIAGETVTLTLTGLTGDAAETRYALATFPDLSAQAVGLLVDDAGDAIRTFVPDTDGVYAFIAYDYRSRSGITDDDPGVTLVATQTGSVYVAAAIELPIATESGRGATLRLRVLNSTVRAAELILPLDEPSRVAILTSAVNTKLAALVGLAMSALTYDFDTDVAAMITTYNAHIALETSHGDPDAVNVVNEDSPRNRLGSVDALLSLADKMRQHLRGRSDDRGTWHALADDTLNYPVAKRERTLARAVVLKSDLRERVYERHRVMLGSPSVHDAADTTNALSAPGPLDELIVAMLDEFVTSSPTTPAGEEVGAVEAAHKLGFVVRR